MKYTNIRTLILHIKVHRGKDNEDRAQQCHSENRQQCGEDKEFEANGLQLMLDKSFIGSSSNCKVLCRNVDTCNRQ